MISNLGPIAVALISWIVFNAIGRPLLKFLDLRTEVRRTTILYDNVHARWTERDNVLASASEDATPNNFERLQEAEHQYRDLGSQVRAFADTQSRPASLSGGLVMIFERLLPVYRLIEYIKHLRKNSGFSQTIHR